MSEFIGTAIGIFMTLAVFSYLIGDNFLFRLAVHLFIGVSAGYVLAVTVFNVLIPQVGVPLIFGTMQERALILLPLLLSALLLAKISPQIAALGSVPMAFLVGVGAAAAVGGAVFGTLFPQTWATMGSLSSPGTTIINGLFLLIGTVSTLLYFNFGGRAKSQSAANGPDLLAIVGMVGGAFIAIAFGVIFAGVYNASLSALIERLSAVWEFIRTFLPMA